MSDAHDPVAARHGSADWLSLSLIDARNHTLRWLAAFEASSIGPRVGADGQPCALWWVGHAAWYADWWVVRHVLAARGEDGDPLRPRLAPADLVSDRHFHAMMRTRHHADELPTPDSIRPWLADTLDCVLDLLGNAGDDDRALYAYRLALRQEDRVAEHLAELAQAVGVAADFPAPGRQRGTATERAPLHLPAHRFQLGSPRGGLVPGPERWAHEVQLPAFDIDAQPVSWARYVEFALDGGYDAPRWWTPAGWAWLQQTGRRAPRHVEQMRQGVVLNRQGRLQRAGAQQAAVHVSRHEAEAWCAWAGRRLPTEAEWEAAACGAGSRGFVWGEVLEWAAGSGPAWPGHADPPGEIDPRPRPGAGAAVLRGACLAAPSRTLHAKARRFASPDHDTSFTGFRSCSL